MDFEGLCGLHFDSASVVKVSNKKAFIYEHYNIEFCNLMNVSNEEYFCALFAALQIAFTQQCKMDNKR